MPKKPTPKQIKVLRQIENQDKLGSVVINNLDAKECADEWWLQELPGGGYALTDEGRKVLADATI